MNLSDLQSKKVISVSTGRNIGNIIDVCITEEGMIDFLIIEQNKNLFSLNKDNIAKINWNEISKIGEDVILVKKD
ncbi:MAG: YlmC/YmxH family sporulation protein [Bacilli bacterium]|nr:YlmC/YmxH family sporulation protein [Bacilli bacterium]